MLYDHHYGSDWSEGIKKKYKSFKTLIWISLTREWEVCCKFIFSCVEATKDGYILQLKPVLEEIESRSSRKEYVQLLAECHKLYCEQRLSLVS